MMGTLGIVIDYCKDFIVISFPHIFSFGEIAIHAFSFFTYPCKLQERETTRTKLEKKNLGIKKKISRDSKHI
jgi:hypothetical protein